MVEEPIKEEKKVTKTKVVDPWKDMKRVRIPRSTDGEANYLIASVNGRVFKLKRGVEIEVPAPVAEVIENSFAAEDEALEYIDKVRNS